MTFEELKIHLQNFKFKRAKVIEDYKNNSVLIAVDGPIDEEIIIYINNVKHLGISLKWRTLYFWECRLNKWVFK